MRRDPNALPPTSINFLPDWYRRRQRGRRILRLQMLLLIGVVAVFGLLIGQELRERGSLSQSRGMMQQRLESMRRRTANIEQLRGTHRELIGSVRVQNRLHRPVGYAQIAATLVELVPDSVSLRRLRMEVGSRTVRVPSEEAEARAEGEGEGEGGSGESPGAEEERRRIVLIQVAGIGPSDSEVSRFTGSLASHPLFDDVEIGYWRQATFEGLHVRRFAVRTTVRLDRRYAAPETEPQRQAQQSPRGAAEPREVTDAG